MMASSSTLIFTWLHRVAPIQDIWEYHTKFGINRTSPPFAPSIIYISGTLVCGKAVCVSRIVSLLCYACCSVETTRRWSSFCRRSTSTSSRCVCLHFRSASTSSTWTSSRPPRRWLVIRRAPSSSVPACSRTTIVWCTSGLTHTCCGLMRYGRRKRFASLASWHRSFWFTVAHYLVLFYCKWQRAEASYIPK